jgi:predicted naringenin-chalcone synthase
MLTYIISSPLLLFESLTGFRLVNLARQVVQGDPDARVLVVEAELRSALGNSMPLKPTRSDIVSVSLFRDAASSAVLGGGFICAGESPCYEIVAGASRIVDATRHLVDYYEMDDGSIRLHLDRRLPDGIGEAEPDFVADLLEKASSVLAGSNYALPSLTSMDILCHTGGPKVLSKVAESLGVSTENLNSSFEVMNSHGNLSGASNLAVLDHHNQMIQSNTQDASEWALCLSMGPGVCLEGIIIRDVRRTTTFSRGPEYQFSQSLLNGFVTKDSRKGTCVRVLFYL